MALIFIDGFDHYEDTDITDKYVSAAAGMNISSVAGEFRSGLSSLDMDANNGQITVTPVDDTQVTYIVGFGFRLSTPQTLDYRDIVSFYEDSAATGVHVSLQITGDRKFRVILGQDNDFLGTLGTTSEMFELDDGFHYIEFKVTIHDTTGSFELKFDEESILSVTGVDTRNNDENSPNGVIKSITFRQVPGAVNNTWYDDLYICDTTGSKNKDFLGDCQVTAIFPKADGALEDFTRSAGADSFALVDDNPPDDDTTHVESNTSGHKDSFDMDDVSGMTTILGVQLTEYARFLTGSASMKHLVRVGGTNYLGSSKTLASAYDFHMNIWEDDPDISSAWTISGINAAEFGMEVV